MEERYLLARRAAAILMQRGEAVFSPIAHSHVIADELPPELRTSHAFWMAQDLPILRACKRLGILALPGWAESRGVTQETGEARSHRIPTVMVFPEDIGLDVGRVLDLMGAN